jgi:putative ABC transport system permease protein
MRRARAWLFRVAGLFRRDGRDQELAEELQAHLAMHIDDNVRAGMTPDAARRAALLRLGSVESITEAVRDRRGVPALHHMGQDVRFAVRMLRKNRSFTAIAALTLGLGIGANTAIFSVVNAVLLRPLPFPDSDRLVLVFATNLEEGRTEDVATYPDFEDWKAQNHSFDALAAFTTRGMTMNAGDHAEIVPAVQVSTGFFDTLGVRPALGRGFGAEEHEPGADRVAILSDGTWRRQFGAAADALGRTIHVNEIPYTVVGVMPPGFQFAPVTGEQLYVPLTRDPSRNHGFLRVLGRLRPAVSIAAAQSDMEGITRRLAEQYPKTNRGVGANVMRLVDASVGGTRYGLWIFLGVVTVVLLIACTNVANLILARDASRQKELAVRRALGAGRGRLVQQLLTESTLLALAGGAVGLVLAHWGTRLLVTLLSRDFAIPRLEATHTDGWVLAFTFVLSAITGLVFGVMPALAAASPDLNENLRETSRTTSSGVRPRRLRAALMIAETALALILLAGAGLLLKTFVVLRATPPGFDRANVLVVDFWLPKSRSATPQERARFSENVLTGMVALPGVESAALVANLPLGDGSDSLSFRIVGRPDPTPRSPHSANFNIVSAGYFRTMRTPIVAGREFTSGDTAGSPRVVVINETAARTFWSGENAIGQQITVPGGGNAGAPLTVVGVAGDVRQMGLARAPKPEIFLNGVQPVPPWSWLVLVLRTSGDPVSIAGPVKSTALTVAPDVPVARVRTLDEILSGSIAEPRVYTLLLGVFAGLALVLAASGLYGVISYNVTERMHEIGIRLALGARRRDVLALVLRQGLGLTALGMTIGLAAAFAVTRLLTRIVPAVQPGDPLTFAAVCVLLMGVAFAASYFPARRGARADPIVCLRAE